MKGIASATVGFGVGINQNEAEASVNLLLALSEREKEDLLEEHWDSYEVTVEEAAADLENYEKHDLVEKYVKEHFPLLEVLRAGVDDQSDDDPVINTIVVVASTVTTSEENSFAPFSLHGANDAEREQLRTFITFAYPELTPAWLIFPWAY